MSVQTESRKDRRNDGRRDQSGPRLNRERHQPYVRTVIPPSLRHAEGPSRPHTRTQRNEREIVYALEKLGTKVKWPQKMKSDPSTQKSNVLCEFHQERGHKTEDCIALWQELVNMLNQGHLRELMSDRWRADFGRGREQHQGPPKTPSPAWTIQMISSGSDEAAINHVKFTTAHKLKRSITHERHDDIDLAFPHSDALVITLRILDTDMKRIVVDDGTGAFERTSGEITLPVLAGVVTLETTFHVMN
ncbi:PREDICTED: uncharacterized protein LOC109232397 [Nicotiana attenuata]|uniref:uncharacterized protein LOC109232397 n=1 Tax=Nicotiana attenuata TaxID=49451 RepID=UPI000905038F|nr:PREDICTED: uncharacterized protein LOC109232397 [Nicotiana attenuata]